MERTVNFLKVKNTGRVVALRVLCSFGVTPLFLFLGVEPFAH